MMDWLHGMEDGHGTDGDVESGSYDGVQYVVPVSMMCSAEKAAPSWESDQQWKEFDVDEKSTQPGPLGLRLSITSSFLDLIEMKLFQGQPRQNLKQEIVTNKIDNAVQIPPSTKKMKALNFAATFLKIGSWERIARYNGDLVVKCYFAKRKLVWEILERGLKSKIEIQWSDITSLRATYHANTTDLLEIELSKVPHFFHETNPQPKKHTLWQEALDFTGGQAVTYRRHLVQFAAGTLEKHYEKLLQCDSRLRMLNNINFPSLISPYFELSDEKYQEHGGHLSDELSQKSSIISYTSSKMSNEISHPPAQVYAQTSRVSTLLNQGGFNHVRPAFDFMSASPSSVMDCLPNEDGSNGFDDIHMGESLRYDKPAHRSIHEAFQGTYLNMSSNIELANQDDNFFQRHEVAYNPSFLASEISGFSENQAVLESIDRDLPFDPFVSKCCDNQNQQIIERVGSPRYLIDAARMSMNTYQEDYSNLMYSQMATKSTDIENTLHSNIYGGYR